LHSSADKLRITGASTFLNGRTRHLASSLATRATLQEKALQERDIQIEAERRVKESWNQKFLQVSRRLARLMGVLADVLSKSRSSTLQRLSELLIINSTDNEINYQYLDALKNAIRSDGDGGALVQVARRQRDIER